MDAIEITLPVTRSAAERLRQPGERARFGTLVSLAAEGLIGPAGVAETLALRQVPLGECAARAAAALTEVQRATIEAGIGAEEVEKELGPWKRERAEVREA